MAEDRPIELWRSEVPVIAWSFGFRRLAEFLVGFAVALAAGTATSYAVDTSAERAFVIGFPLGLTVLFGGALLLVGGYRGRHGRVDASGIHIRGRHVPAAAIGEVLVLWPDQTREVMGTRPNARGTMQFEGRRIGWRTAYTYGDDQPTLVFERRDLDREARYSLYSLPPGTDVEQVAATLRLARDLTTARAPSPSDDAETP